MRSHLNSTKLYIRFNNKINYKYPNFFFSLKNNKNNSLEFLNNDNKLESKSLFPFQCSQLQNPIFLWVKTNNNSNVYFQNDLIFINNKRFTSKNKFQKRNFCESFKEKEDYVYIIGIRSKTLKNIRREINPQINQYFESSKSNNLTFNDIREIEQLYMKLEKDAKIASTLRTCLIFIKKNFYSKHLIDYFIDNCSEIAEDSLFNLNGFIFYINGLELKPNQINFNPNFFKIVEENFFKEGILMDLNDIKVYLRFFYRFKSCFSQKLINYSERCLIYLLENMNSYTLHNLYQVNDIIKYCFISGSDRCFQKIVDYYSKMILVKSSNYLETIEFLKVMATLTGKVLRFENILNYEIKYEILVRGFDNIKGKIYEYISKEKVEINCLKNLLQILIQNKSIGYFKGINLRDIIVNYIIKNENDIDPDNLRALLRNMVSNKNFLIRYQNEINQLILSNLSELETINNITMGILYNYLRFSIEPNAEIRGFTELLLIKAFLINSGETSSNFPMLYLIHKYFYNEIVKKNISSFFGFCLLEGYEKIKKQKEEELEFQKEQSLKDDSTFIRGEEEEE